MSPRAQRPVQIVPREVEAARMNTRIASREERLISTHPTRRRTPAPVPTAASPSRRCLLTERVLAPMPVTANLRAQPRALAPRAAPGPLPQPAGPPLEEPPAADPPPLPAPRRTRRAAAPAAPVHANIITQAARGPYVDPPHRHDLGEMDIACPRCGALHWEGELLSKASRRSPRFGMCCGQGRVQLPPLRDPPAFLQTWLTSQAPRAVKFRQEVWKYNRAFAFTSLGVHEDHSVNRGNGPPVFKISGELHHYSGALDPPEGRARRYAQLYVYEPRAALESRIHQNQGLEHDVMGAIQTMLSTHHQYVPVYKHAFEILQKYDPSDDAVVRLRVTPGLDRRRYNLPTVDEVAVILPGSGSREPRDIVLRLRDGPLHRISDLHPAYAPLQYPLLFPHGENGWHPALRLLEKENNAERDDDAEEQAFSQRRLTLRHYAAYRMQFRPTEFNTLLRGGRLFARYVVDLFASIDQQRLLWYELNQQQFRAARYNNLEDANMNDPDNMDLNEIGQRVFLPSSYIGGPRNMCQRYQDAMAISRYYRNVDLFLTMTTNPEWEEIRRELRRFPGQTAYDRPDLVARVFHLKKDSIIERIHKEGIFGQAVAYVYTIEFQKRGLPHVHLLIYLEQPYKLLTPEAINSCIQARWPDPVTQPKLFETVKSCMIHTCSDRCLERGKCSKGFPKEFCEFTTMDPNGYPRYARPDDGVAYEVNGRMVDNRWIVPFNPFLLGNYHCHINVECAVSIASIKYVFKYVYKGPDRGSLEVEMKNEVKRYVDGRYISAPDAAWRILKFETHQQVPNVVRLQVHLPGQHIVTFNPNHDPEDVLQRGQAAVTTLTAFFEANRDDGELGQEARKYTYQEFPQHFTFHAATKKWRIRSQGFAIGRMYFIKPTAGEVFYLRTLLTVVKGATSFEDLRTVPDRYEPEPTFHAACVARGLLEDDGEWRICLQEATAMHTGARLRRLFATLLMFGEPAQPDVLWNEFKLQICDDLQHRLRAMGVNDPSEQRVCDYGLYLLGRLLQENGHSLEDWPSMPRPLENWNALTLNPLIAEQLNYNQDEQRADFLDRHARLNVEQCAAYDSVIASIESNEGKLFFLNGPGGTGKTFVYNTICAKLRSEGKIILCVSSSGISALLIRGGRTAHSMFKIPIDGLNDKSVCPISKNSNRADLMREAKAIIWDEVSAQHRHAVEAVDRTLRDLRESDRPFGGLTVVLGGDYLQTLPVVPRGSREEIVDSTVQRSTLWDDVQILRLVQNLRLNRDDAESVEFAQWLLDVGHGRIMDDKSYVQLPDSMRVHTSEELINSIYSGVGSRPPPPPDYFENRMILAPRNTDVASLNEDILERMAGETRTYFSADEPIHEAGADPTEEEPIPVEFLRSLAPASLPPGELHLKIGCPVILLRNLSPSSGLCNGTRMIITRMSDRVLEARLIGGQHDGETVMIPRISLIPTTLTDLAFRFKRRQFPIRLAFALTINKAQGQSVRHVGINVALPVFAHGQLYVALSRATAKQNVKVLLPEDTIGSKTQNVVYSEVLI